jgi:tetratricopeptide (TPR) repeat protein
VLLLYFANPRLNALLLCAVVSAALALPPPQQSQPTQADREEARRHGEEQSRQQRQRQQESLNSRPDYYRTRMYRVEGNVLMAGGGPPPDGVTITAFCGGQAMAKTISNAKGKFSLQLGSASETQLDATVGRTGGPGINTASVFSGVGGDCALAAFLLGFRAEPFPLDRLQTLQVTHASIILHPLVKVSGYTFSATSLLAPTDAKKAHQKGKQAFDKRQLDEAEKHLKRAAELHPKYAEAWYDLGRVLMLKGRLQEARQAFESSASSDPKYINPYPVLTQLAVDEKRWEDVARHTMTVIALNPFFSANIYVFSAQANLLLQKMDLAELHAREAIRMDEANRLPVARRLLARILSTKGKLTEAMQQLQSCLMHTSAGPEAEAIKAEIAVLEEQISPR